MISRTTSVRVAALAAAAAVALSGCGAVNAGVAAKVGDETISVSFVQDQVQQVIEKSGQESVPEEQVDQFQKQVLLQLVVSKLVTQTAEEAGVSATPAELQKAEQMVLQQSPQPPGLLEATTQLVALGDKLNSRYGNQSQQKVIETARTAGVELNPRYGVWSERILTHGEEIASGDLVRVAEPTPDPAVPQLPGQ